MLRHFIIPYCDWEVFFFYEPKDYSFILELLNSCNCEESTKSKIIKFIKHNKINEALCYSSFNNKLSIIIINSVDSKAEFFNSLVHELNHLGSHIEEYYNINPHGEEASLIMGNIAGRIFM